MYCYSLQYKWNHSKTLACLVILWMINLLHRPSLLPSQPLPFMTMLTIHQLVTVLGCLAGHENRITSLSVAGNGMAVATCSWDQNVRVWV
jgi:WD40 repeat protein